MSRGHATAVAINHRLAQAAFVDVAGKPVAYEPKRTVDGDPITPRNQEALASIERTAQCMSASERMLERLRARR